VELMKLCVNTGFQKCALIYYGFNWFKNPGEIYFTHLTYWGKASYTVPDTEMQCAYDISSRYEKT
jgi:hypothetical protein